MSARGVWTSLRAAALLLILAGCTGTFEARPPTLLVVAFDDGGPAVALVRDTFNALQPGETRALEFLAASARGLPAPAVAVDVVDRAGSRPTAVFLLREATSEPTDPPTTFLRGFSLGGIDPEAPAAFDEVPRFGRLLANGGPAGDEGILEASAVDAYCPTEIQMSDSGRYVAIFESRSACGDAEFRAIHVIDLDAVDAASPNPVVSIESPAPGAAGIYLDQDGDLDPEGRAALYWVDPTAGVRAFDLATETIRTPDVTGDPFDAGSVRDIGRIQDLLVLVMQDALVLVDLLASPPTANVVDSASGLTELVVDPFAVTDDAVLLAGDTLVVHPDAREDALAEESSAAARTGAVLEPIDRFVYLLSDGRIGVFDLLEFDGERISVTPFAVPEVPGAAAVTWTRARVEPTP